ncbi:hypothetical protein Baya_5248 [Bagarius yarrelli]|uniref:Uncharacterized protein n=1 Tax=Bagarius yarrelli TaxID=175774 RepID=A0A556TU00_BAGYA|nr:hypothetical protein Baya_5248 [Bagarius yarrelli]
MTGSRNPNTSFVLAFIGKQRSHRYACVHLGIKCFNHTRYAMKKSHPSLIGLGKPSGSPGKNDARMKRYCDKLDPEHHNDEIQNRHQYATAADVIRSMCPSRARSLPQHRNEIGRLGISLRAALDTLDGLLFRPVVLFGENLSKQTSDTQDSVHTVWVCVCVWAYVPFQQSRRRQDDVSPLVLALSSVSQNKAEDDGDFHTSGADL